MQLGRTPLDAPREVWAQIATAARRHANFDPRQLALVSTAARDGVRDAAPGWPGRLQEIVNFGRTHIRTAQSGIHEGRRMGIARATGVYLQQGRSLYDAALSALTAGTGTFEPTDLDRMEMQGDSPHPDEHLAWCEESLQDVCDPWDAQAYFKNWYRIFAYYDPVAKAWLRLVCSDSRVDLDSAWDQARRDYVASKGVPVL